MKRYADIAIIFLCCLPLVAFGMTGGIAVPIMLVGLLSAALCATLTLLLPERAMALPGAVYCVACLFFDPFIVLMPVIAAALQRVRFVPLRFAWVPFYLLTFGRPNHTTWILTGVVCLAAVLAAYSTAETGRTIDELQVLRDSTRERAFALERRESELLDAQDMQVRLATMNERGRIAREIHDNVGHLLTRAIMQVEALQVVHADEVSVARDFSDVGETLHTAMDTVRSSVHDLHDDSIDLRGSLEDALDTCPVAETSLDYRIDAAPTDVAYCMMAVAREALSNTVRHSDADRVSIEAVELPGLFQLRIRDNGSTPPQGGGSGIGMQTMEDRVRRLNGTFSAEYDAGFRIFATIPKHAERKGERA